jgi:hypothetical protein
MTSEARISVLKDFFAAYFHEDWPCEAENDEAVVRLYMRTSTPDNNRTLASAILDYTKIYSDDITLKQMLYKELGCYYNPVVDGLSTKDWLHRIATLLLEISNSPIDHQ